MTTYDMFKNDDVFSIWLRVVCKKYQNLVILSKGLNYE